MGCRRWVAQSRAGDGRDGCPSASPFLRLPLHRRPSACCLLLQCPPVLVATGPSASVNPGNCLLGCPTSPWCPPSPLYPPLSWYSLLPPYSPFSWHPPSPWYPLIPVLSSIPVPTTIQFDRAVPVPTARAKPTVPMVMGTVPPRPVPSLERGHHPGGPGTASIIDARSGCGVPALPVPLPRGASGSVGVQPLCHHATSMAPCPQPPCGSTGATGRLQHHLYFANSV